MLTVAFGSTVTAQRLAIAWERSEVSDSFVAALLDTEHAPLKLLDTDLSRTAITAAIGSKLNNLTAEQGRLAAAVAGSDHVLFVRAEALRRNSFELGDHFEAWAVVFVVEGRNGRLLSSFLRSGKAKTEHKAIEDLIAQAQPTMTALSQLLREAKIIENVPTMSPLSIPAAGSTESVGFVAPIPFKRIKPEYTSTAFLYSVAATVEIEIDLDETGKVTRTNIVRWAGFGLDESVEKAVREMQWRPAYFGKAARPIRFVAQYNFRKPQ